MIKLISVVSYDYDMGFLPHMARYWSARGVDESHVILHSHSEFELPALSWFGPIELSQWVGKFNSGEKAARIRNSAGQCKSTDFYVAPDADEYPMMSTVEDALRKHSAHQSVVYGCFVDRFATPKPGVLVPLKPDVPLEQQYPYNGSKWVRRMFRRASRYRPVIMRGDVTYRGLHVLASHPLKLWRADGGKLIPINHYKWVGHRIEKAEQRVADWRDDPRHPHWKTSATLLKKVKRELPVQEQESDP